MSKFKINDKVTLKIGSGAPDKDAVVIDTGRSITKIRWFYTSKDGKQLSADGWYQDKFITKRKK